MTEEQSQTLLDQQKSILEKLERHNKKDFWDKFSSSSAVLSSLVIAIIGFHFTNVYKEQEVRIAEAQTIERFIQHLNGSNENEKKGAILAIAALGNNELATRIGSMYASTGTIEALEVILEKAKGDAKAALVESLVDAYFNRGREFIHKNMPDSAIQDYNHILKLESDEQIIAKRGNFFLAAVYGNRGIGYFQKPDYARCLDDTKRALELFPEQAYGHLYLGELHRVEQKKDEALAEYELAIKYNNDADAFFYVTRAYFFYNEGEFQKAVDDYSQAIKLDSHDFWCLYYRGLSYMRLGRFNEALNDFKQARPLAPDNQRLKLDDELSKAEAAVKGDFAARGSQTSTSVQ
jgi:tetratricopeptide (TPR) repeat protein